MVNQVIMSIVERLHILCGISSAKISKIFEFCNVEMAKLGKCCFKSLDVKFQFTIFFDLTKKAGVYTGFYYIHQ
jgi:hypothetical protein